VDKGENARTSAFAGAIAIADLVKTTLGPKGMDKILQSVRTWRRLCARGAAYVVSRTHVQYVHTDELQER